MKNHRRKRKYSLSLKYKVTLTMLVVVVSIALLVFSFKTDHLYLTDFINDIFYYPFTNLTNKEDLIGQNINDELEKEIASLKDMTNINNVLTDFTKTNAVVISRNPSYWLDEIVINRGSNHGLEEKMAVAVSEGLVGYISKVYDNSSVVTLVTNPSYNRTSIRIKDNYLILDFDENNNLIVNQLDNTDTIKVGDVVYTSGLTDKYPAGLTIGYISKIENNNYGNGKKLYVSLYYDINSLRYVSVLKRSTK